MMTDMCIRTGEEQRLSPVVGPAYEVGRSSLPAHLDDLAVSHWTAEHGGCDHNPITDCCFHRRSFESRRYIEADDSTASVGKPGGPRQGPKHGTLGTFVTLWDQRSHKIDDQ